MEKLEKFSICSHLPHHEDHDILQNQYLFETLKVENHHILDFDLHINRVKRSLDFFKKSLPLTSSAILQFLNSKELPSEAHLRINFTAHNVWGEFSSLPHYPAILRMGFDEKAITDSTKNSRQHKLSDYSLYSEIKKQRTDLDEVVFVNEKEEITETTRANLFYFDEKRKIFITPPVSSGLIPGIERQKLLTQGFVNFKGVNVEIKEEILLKKQITPKAFFFVTNSLMGIRRGFII